MGSRPSPRPEAALEKAAELVARWKDLWTVEVHELRQHLVLDGLLKAFYEGLRMERPWFLLATFPTPLRDEPVAVAFAVGRFRDGLRATLQEGNPHDFQRPAFRDATLADLGRAEPRILGSAAAWINPYIAHGIRGALFGSPQSACWMDLQDRPEAEGPRLALWTLFHVNGQSREHLEALRGRPRPNTTYQVQAWPWSRPGAFKPDPAMADRAEKVLARAAQLRVRIPPQNLALDAVRARNPPPGVRRKGLALTVTEQLCWHLVDEPRGPRFTASEAADALGIPDARQVRRALADAARKKAAWPPPPKD